MIGLKKGEIVLCEHQIHWELNAKSTINKLKEILGDIAIDIQHIGSTSIKNIKAKPVIDIIVGVIDLIKYYLLILNCTKTVFSFEAMKEMKNNLFFNVVSFLLKRKI